MIKKTLSLMLLLCAILPLLTACNHKELCIKHPHTRKLNLVFDWRDAPEANPAGMCVFFYPLDENSDAPLRRFDFTGTTGGEISIQTGRYHVICYNNDTEAVQIRGVDTFEAHEGYTRNGHIFEPINGSGGDYAPRATGSDDERVVICPDMMWGGTEFDIEVSENGVIYWQHNHADSKSGIRYEEANPDGQTITLYPHELVCHYSYEIRNVKNLKYAYQMTATLSGMAPSLFIGHEDLHVEPVTVPFGAASDQVSKITGNFLVFGHHEQNVQPHKLVLYVWFTDGSKYYYTFDVTKQVHDAPDKRHVHLILDGPEFPQPFTNGSGFDPTVDDWQTVEDDLIM